MAMRRLIVALLVPTAVSFSLRHNTHGHFTMFKSQKQLQSKLLAKKPSSAFNKQNIKSSKTRQTQVTALLEWCQSVNIQVSDSIGLKPDSFGGLGWFTSKPAAIQPNSILLSVPSAVALTVDCPGDGPNDSVWKALSLEKHQESIKLLPWYVQMSLYLHKLDQIDSNKNKINLRPWLNSLPRTFTTPIHWDDATRAELQYDSLINNIDQQQKRWRQNYDQVQSILSALSQSLSWKDFLWGCEIARSRAFSGSAKAAFNPLLYVFTLFLVTAYVGLNIGTLEQASNGAGVVLCAFVLKDFVLPKLINKKQKRYVICPMIDMANHNSIYASGQVSFEYFGNAYSLSLSSTIDENNKSNNKQPDNEIFISYGPRSNDQLLQYYGFVEPDNPQDVYVLPSLSDWDITALEQAGGRVFSSGRLEKLEQAGLLGNKDQTETVKNEDQVDARKNGVVLTRSGMDPAILQALRTLVSTDEEWQAANRSVGNFALEFSGGSNNEQCVRQIIKTVIAMELAAKATTLEQDIELLKRMESIQSLDASGEQKLAIEFRIEKKKFLKEVLKLYL